MSQRYEMDTPDCNLDLVAPGNELGEDRLDPGNYGLVIGNPWSSAYVIEGSLAGLREFVQRISDRLEWTERLQGRADVTTNAITPDSQN